MKKPKQRFEIKLEPYKSRVIANNYAPIESSPNGLSFPVESIYDIAKSTGLKSNKTRHILKRFKKVITLALYDSIQQKEIVK